MCDHKHVVDNGEGSYVCIECAFIVDFSYKEHIIDCPNEKSNKYDKNKDVLEHLCTNNNFPLYLASNTINIYNKLSSTKRFKNKKEDILLYLLYYEIHKSRRNYTLQEYELISGLSKSSYCKISNKFLRLELNRYNPHHMISRFCSELNLNFKQYLGVKTIFDIINTEFYFIKQSSLISICIAIYCKTKQL